MAKRFFNLTLGGNNVEVRQWPTTSKTKELEDALKEIDSSYNPNLSLINDLKKMPRTAKIKNDTEHCIRSEYMVQFRICGKLNCEICGIIGRKQRTPNSTDDVLKKATRAWVPLPIPNPIDKDHYLPPRETILHIKRKELSIEDQKTFLPPLVKKSDDTKLLLDKAADKENKN